MVEVVYFGCLFIFSYLFIYTSSEVFHPGVSILRLFSQLGSARHACLFFFFSFFSSLWVSG